MATVRESPGPYFFVAEAVFVYLEEREVRSALAQIRNSFPDAMLAFDTASRRAIEGGNKDFARRKLAARFAWACEHPKDVEDWNIGLRLVESRTMVDVPDALVPRLSLATRITFRGFRKFFPRLMKVYQLNLFTGSGSTPGTGGW